jgi:hypothetical protein
MAARFLPYRIQNMKLHDALRKIIREFGVSVLQEKRLVFLLSDYRAFDDFPAMRQVMKAIAEDGYGKELSRIGLDGSDEECLASARELKSALVREKGFREEFAEYAADSILLAFRLTSSVREPLDHGFDPMRKDSEHGIAPEVQKDSEGTGQRSSPGDAGTHGQAAKSATKAEARRKALKALEAAIRRHARQSDTKTETAAAMAEKSKTARTTDTAAEADSVGSRDHPRTEPAQQWDQAGTEHQKIPRYVILIVIGLVTVLLAVGGLVWFWETYPNGARFTIAATGLVVFMVIWTKFQDSWYE